jgi:hypothetical protein
MPGSVCAVCARGVSGDQVLGIRCKHVTCMHAHTLVKKDCKLAACWWATSNLVLAVLGCYVCHAWND